MGYESKEFALSDLIFDSPLSFCAFLIEIRLNGISLFYFVLSYSKELFNAEWLKNFEGNIYSDRNIAWNCTIL